MRAPVKPTVRPPLQAGTKPPAPARPAAPRPAAPIIAARRPRPTPLTSSRAGTFTAGGLISVLVVGGLIGLRVCNTAKRITGQTVVDETLTIPADKQHGGTIQVEGSHSYTFDVTALDRPLRMAFGRIQNPQKPTAQELVALLQSAVDVPSGQKRTLSGRVNDGCYVWVVFNMDGKQQARAQIRFNGK